MHALINGQRSKPLLIRRHKHIHSTFAFVEASAALRLASGHPHPPLTATVISVVVKLTFSLRRFRPPAQARSAHVNMVHAVHRDLAIAISGAEYGANEVDVEPHPETAHPFWPTGTEPFAGRHKAQWTPWTCPTC